MAGTSASKIKVTGKVKLIKSTKCFYWHLHLRWYEDGKLQRKSVATGLSETNDTNTRNKTRAKELLEVEIEKQEQFLEDELNEQEALLAAQPTREGILFADFMMQWLDIIKPTVKPTTFGSYQHNVQEVIAPYFREKDILLRELTTANILEFYDFQYKRVGKKTVQNYHANIHTALECAIERDYIDKNPIDKVKRPKAPKYNAKFLTLPETAELRAAVKGHKLELGVLLGAYYGLRRSEIVGLRWESISFDTNNITIEHTVTAANIDGKTIITADDTTKNKSSLRTLPLLPFLREKLLEIKAEQELHRKLCGKSYNKKEGIYIYTDALGNRIKPDYLSSEFPKFCDEHELRRVRFHDLRHSCASLLLANGVHMSDIQEWLGHSTYHTTAEMYAHKEVNSKRSTANAMEAIEGKTRTQE